MVDLAPVADARRQASADVIRAAARTLLLERGLDVTMDDIAEAAGVGRRTVFRHFETREKLLAAALSEGFQRYGDALPQLGDDWEVWLRDLCAATHRMQAGYGPGYWELLHRTDLPPELRDVEADRRRRKRKAMQSTADRLWRAAHGSDEAAPAAFSATVAAHLSAQFTVAVLHDAGGTWKLAAELAHDAIRAALPA